MAKNTDSMKLWENIFEDIQKYFKEKEYKKGVEKEKSIQHQMMLYYLNLKFFEEDYENKDNFFQINYIDVIELIIEMNIEKEEYEICEILKKTADKIKKEIK